MEHEYKKSFGKWGAITVTGLVAGVIGLAAAKFENCSPTTEPPTDVVDAGLPAEDAGETPVDPGQEPTEDAGLVLPPE